MDILNYTEEHRIFRDTLRKFLEKEVSPFVDEWEEAGIVPKSIWKKMGEQGFLCTDDPGGIRRSGSRFSLFGHCLRGADPNQPYRSGRPAAQRCGRALYQRIRLGRAEARNILPGCVSGDIITAIAMTEPNTGSDLAAIRTTAVEDGDSGRYQRPKDLYQ